jgi:outer membrane protein OmpA-like peptidoglycan-associated protein
MDERGARSILSGKFKIGGDAAAAAGPIGRDSQANLDVYFRTTILSYSRSRGLFAGVSLEGSTLRPDKRANEKLYGKPLSAKSIVLENAVAPPAPGSAEKLVETLNKYGKNASETSTSAAAISPSAPSTAEPVSTPAPAPSSASAAAAAPPPAAQSSDSTAAAVAPPAPANRPPTATCSADPAPIVSGSGNTVLVRAEASDPDNDPLTYTWTAAAGTIEGSGAEVHWNPAGVAPGAYSVTAHVDDGRGGTVECQAALRVEAPPRAVETKLAIHSVFFPTALPSTKQPNKGLMESQQETLTVLANDFKEYRKGQPDAHLVLEGHADHRGRQALNEGLSERRVEITKRFLIGLGIPEASLETKAQGEEQNITQEQVKQLVEQNPNLTPEQKHKILSQLRIVTLAQNRRVDITLSSTGQQSVRNFPFNAEDALTLLSPKRGRSKS